MVLVPVYNLGYESRWEMQAFLEFSHGQLRGVTQPGRCNASAGVIVWLSPEGNTWYARHFGAYLWAVL